MELLLTENRTQRATLSVQQVDALVTHIPKLTVLPVIGSPGEYALTPAQFVGQARFAEMHVEIRPKIAMRAVMFMLAYTIDSKHWRDLLALFESQSGLLDAVATAFGRELARTFSRGLLRGYTAREESLPVLRGRVIVPEQLRRWFGEIPPVECRYDEFTEDVLENRLLKAALSALRGLRVRNALARSQLAHAEAQLENVADMPFDSRALPEISYTRLNERFKRAIELARLILRSGTIETGRAGVASSAFLVDLAGVFERFVLTALRESPALRPWSIPPNKEIAFLDVGRRLRLIPDLVFRHLGRVVTVGDVKYKRTPPSVGVLHSDLYQVLAYAVALDLPHAFLVYPKADEGDEVTSHVVQHARKSLHAFGLDLDVSPEQLLGSVADLASSIRAHASVAA